MSHKVNLVLAKNQAASNGEKKKKNVEDTFSNQGQELSESNKVVF